MICNLCSYVDINSGKDKLLYEDDFCYIVENGNTHLKEGDKLKFAKRRISLILREHRSILSKDELDKLETFLKNFILKNFQLEYGVNYFIKCTMGTYSDHYHTHAYILPFSEDGIII